MISRAIPLALLLLGSPAALAQVQLDFERAEGAENCFDQPGFEAAMFAAFGCRIWAPQSTRLLKIRFAPDGAGLKGTVEGIDNGIAAGERAFDSKTKNCHALQDSVARAAKNWIQPPGNPSPCPGLTLPIANVTISAADGSASEPRAGGKSIVPFELSLSAPQPAAVTVEVSTSDESAIAGLDFVALLTTTITFAPGELRKFVDVELLADAAPEGPETFSLDLANPSANAGFRASRHATGTIVDESYIPPVLSISHDELKEPASGALDAALRISLDRSGDEPIAVYATTVDVTATAGSDYAPVFSTRIEFAPGETERPFRIPILADDTEESPETFEVVLSQPTANARIGMSNGVVRIHNRMRPGKIFTVPVYAGTDGGYLFWSGGRKGLDQNNQSLVLSGSVVAGGEAQVAQKYSLDIGMVGLAAAKRDTRYRTSFERLAPRTGNPEKKYFVNEAITAFGLRGALRRDEAETSVSIGLFAGNWLQDGCRESRRTQSAGDPICGSFEQWVVLPTFGLRMGPPTGPYVRLGFLDGRFLASDIGHLTVGARLPRDIQIEVGAVAAYDGVGSKIEALIPLRDSRVVIAPMVASGVPWTVFDPTVDGTGTGSWFRAGVIFAMRR